jgi:ABC-2 type transport system permease protein
MKNNINIVPIIFKHECKQLLRGRSFLWFSVLLLLIGIYAIIYGNNEVKEQQQKIALLQNNIDSLYKNTTDSLLLSDTTASFVGEFLGRSHINKPDGMAALAFGQRDIHKFAQHITNGSFFYNKYASGYVNKTQNSEIVNPFKLLSGHLDISFVLVFLLPLYFILLGYNLLSTEEEGGTIRLLTLQSPSLSKIIFTKLALRLLTVIVLGLVLLFIAGSINAVLSDKRWWFFVLSFLAYIICWAGIIAFVVSFNKSSGLNALSLVSIWILLVLLLPSLLNGVISVIKPITTKTALSAAVQKANAEVWALPKPIRIDSFKTLRPYYAKSFDSVGSWEDPKFFRINHYLTDHYIAPFEQSRIERVIERNEFAERLNYFSPALITQSIFNELSSSNMTQMLAYDTFSYHYFKEVSRFTDDLIFLHGDRITKDDIKKLPKMNFKPEVRTESVIWQCIILSFLGISLMLIYALKMKSL